MMVPAVTPEDCVGVALPRSGTCFSLPRGLCSPLEQGGAVGRCQGGRCRRAGGQVALT